MSQDLKSLRLLAKRHGINLTNNGKYKTKAMLTNELNKLAIPVQTPVQTPVQISSRSTPSQIHIENDDEGKKTIHIPPSSTGFIVNIYMTQNNQKESKESKDAEGKESKESKYESKYESKESKYDVPPKQSPPPPPPPLQTQKLAPQAPQLSLLLPRK